MPPALALVGLPIALPTPALLEPWTRPNTPGDVSMRLNGRRIELAGKSEGYDDVKAEISAIADIEGRDSAEVGCWFGEAGRGDESSSTVLTQLISNTQERAARDFFLRWLDFTINSSSGRH